MKKTVLLSFIIFISLSLEGKAETYRVLFIGNSYIYTNNLPVLVDSFFKAAGDTLIYDLSAPGGYTLQNHLGNATTLAKINSNAWDVVILQEQSQMPSFPPTQVANQVLPYAEQLDSLIRLNHPCSRTLFFMTWGRKYGDAQNCPNYPPLCTFEGMQQRLRESYLLMRDQNLAETAPVGPAFHYMRLQDSTINLYSSDNSHPSLFGSYLAAAVFYSAITGESASLLAVGAGVNSAYGNALRNAADEVCFDSLSFWRTPPPTSSFGYSTNGLQASFTSTSQYAYTHTWLFGDGGMSAQTNPMHTYPGNGSYQVDLETSNRCLTAGSNQNINIGPNSLNDIKQKSFEVSSNARELVVHCTSAGTLFVTNSIGQQINRFNLMPGMQVLPAPVASGFYHLNFQSAESNHHQTISLSEASH